MKNVLLLSLALTANAGAFPSWMGVYGSFVRHTAGGNPGAFTVLMNQDYSGLHASVGIQVNGSSFIEYSMTYAGYDVDAGISNSVWTYTPSATYPAGVVVQYYFRGYEDSSSSTIYDSNSGSNYYFKIGSDENEPVLSSWFTKNSGQYARIRETTGSAPIATWTGQTLPAYSDVQMIAYSTNYVYVYAAGLASHVMGPWYLDANKTMLFPNKPVNQRVTMRFPRTPLAAGITHSSTSLGANGMYVNGTALFNMQDAFSYDNATSSDRSPQQGGDGIWNRDAGFAEILTFDANNAHQPQNGQYHSHLNPVALRYQLGDNATFNAASNTYSEYTNSLHHSPILGWTYDGFPIYGPYGYSAATDSASGIRRMISGFVLRNGQYGTSNLSVTGRTTLPVWAQIVQNRTSLTSSQYGPATTKTPDMTGSFAVGRYAEDYDHLADLPASAAQWDLDRYNGRYCVTPDFPNGTYAYFVTINANGSGAFPYVTGWQLNGVVSGGTVASITESVTTQFVGGANSTMEITGLTAGGSDVVLTWSSVEGGTYTVSASSDLSTWSDLNPTIGATGVVSQASEAGAASNNSKRFYKLRRSSLASYDP